AGGVEDRARREHPLVVRVEEFRVPRLGGKYGVAEEENEPVRPEHGGAIPLPILVTGEEEPLDGVSRPVPIQYPGHEPAEGDREQDREANDDDREEPHGSTFGSFESNRHTRVRPRHTPAAESARTIRAATARRSGSRTGTRSRAR